MSLAQAQRALAMVQRAKKRGTAADIVFIRELAGEGNYHPETGLTARTVEWAGIAVVLPASQGTVEAFDSRLEGGTLIDSKLKALLIPALGLERAPAPGDKVRYPDGTIEALLGCTGLNPDAANPIIYQGTTKI